MEILIVRNNGMGMRIEKVVVPDTEKSKQDGNVFLIGSRKEMLIHRMSSCKQLLKVLESDIEGDGKTDGRPQ